MPGSSTTYQVNVEYKVIDKAMSGISAIHGAAGRLSDTLFSMKGAIAAVGAFAAFGKGKELLIDFNQEMFTLKQSMSVVMQMNMHLPFQKATDAANDLFNKFQDIAKRSPFLTSDFMHMAAMIAPAISMAGGGVQSLQTMTEGAVKAGMAFNIRPDQMAMDIQEMLQGNVRLTSRTARSLIASQGIDYHDFNHLDMSKRAQMTQKILTDPAILRGNEIMAHSFSGEWSTIADNLQIQFGKAGEALNGQFTDTFRQINEWIQTHPEKIRKWVADLSGGLTKAFDFFRNVTEFITRNKDTLLTIAKAYGMYRITSAAGSILGFGGVSGQGKGTGAGAVSGFSGMAENFASGYYGKYRGTAFQGFGTSIGRGVGGVISGMGGILPALGGVALVAGSVVTAFTLLRDVINREATERQKNVDSLGFALKEFDETRNRTSFLAGQTNRSDRATNELEALRTKTLSPEFLGEQIKRIDELSRSQGGKGLRDLSFDQLRDMKLETSLKDRVEGKTSLLETLFPHTDFFQNDPSTWEKNQLIKSNTLALFELLQGLAPMDKSMQSFSDTLQGKSTLMSDTLLNAFKVAFPDQFGKLRPNDVSEDWKPVKDKNVNVTIQRVEVASEDPDRFVFGLARIAEDGLKHATQSQHVIPGGF